MPNSTRSGLIRFVALAATVLLAACSGGDVWPALSLGPEARAMYASRRDGGFEVPAVPPRHLIEAENQRRVVPYWTEERPGSIIVDPWQKFLYFVLEDDQAIRYRIGVGEAGRQFSGRARVGMKREWPTWTPTARMLREEPALYEPWAGGMDGGLQNPLGARAMYLFKNGRDTLYRIHGTHAPWSIGQALSAGCIRLFNQDAIDLYERVEEGARVVVLTEDQAGLGAMPSLGV